LVKITPIGICLLDQRNLPRSPPLFDFFLTFDRGLRVVVTFKADKTIDAVPLGEATRDLVFVLVNPADEVARYANIQGSLFAAGEDVDVELHGNLVVIPGRPKAGPGIQKRALCLRLDSGFALSARPGMTAREDESKAVGQCQSADRMKSVSSLLDGAISAVTRVFDT
jgi:hypothetical protein